MPKIWQCNFTQFYMVGICVSTLTLPTLMQTILFLDEILCKCELKKIGDTFPFLGRKFAKFWNNQNKFHHILTQILIGQDIIKAVFNFWASSRNLLPFNVIFVLGWLQLMQHQKNWKRKWGVDVSTNVVRISSLQC
jgi:hypothetical protein